MNEQIIKYFQGELNTTERLRFLRQVEADGELKKQFIDTVQQNYPDKKDA